MKKNVMMRLASFLLVAVLISTSAISGTYAKYVTEAEGKEAARVAKWGVKVGVKGFDNVNDGLFSKTYAADSATSITTTVEAEDKVVAPGTKNANGVSFTLTGTPEVAVKIDFVVKSSKSDKAIDVVLPAGEYTDWTESVNGEYKNTYTAAEYHPVVFTLIDNDSPKVPLKVGTLAEIEAYLEAKTGEYEPNADLSKIFAANGSGNYTLTWEWAFETGHDKEDTTLGNIAAGTTSLQSASTALDIAVSITATQID